MMYYMNRTKKNPAHKQQLMSGKVETEMSGLTIAASYMDSIMCYAGSLLEHVVASACGAGGIHVERPTQNKERMRTLSGVLPVGTDAHS